MSEFRLKVELPRNQNKINISDCFQSWGSCFADNIGKLLADDKFCCDMNPFGTLYNPLSIARAVGELLDGKVYSDDDVCFHNGQWSSYMHHSVFSDTNRKMCLESINSRLSSGRDFIRKANWILITWGTAWVYRLKSTQEIVGNCHKMPDSFFTRSKLEVEEIVAAYQNLIRAILKVNPKVHFLFTVSPIRHAKDGMHGNQLSKSTLLLAADKLCDEFDACHYFPSYEIMMDELRDYRFYADDMLHPTPLAVNYIWECFAECYFSPSTKSFLKTWEKVKKGLAHRPFDVKSEAHQRFLREILLKIEQLKEKMPYLDVENEIKICQAQLKQ